MIHLFYNDKVLGYGNMESKGKKENNLNYAFFFLLTKILTKALVTGKNHILGVI